MRLRPRTIAPALLTWLDLTGTGLFSFEGALAAIAHRLDLFGTLVLGFATALGGGMIRDVLLGAQPPAALLDARYGLAALLGGLAAFVGHGLLLSHVPFRLLVALDAAGLALFAVAGTQKALQYELHPGSVVLLGTITGVGGGTMRDIMLAEIPAVLRVDIYATAALAGSAIMVAAIRLPPRLTPTRAAILGAVTCFVLRLLAFWQHWRLPTAS